MGVEDEDELQLSSHALEALQGFYQERDAHQRQFEDLKAQAENDYSENPLSMKAFTEDWNASQFWYHDETAITLAKALLSGTTRSNAIAVISAPSVYIQIKNLLAKIDKNEKPRVALLEFDERFAIFNDFVYYDYAQPLKLPESLKNNFDRIIIDPPFLSEDCQTKVALTVRALAKSWPLISAAVGPKHLDLGEDNSLGEMESQIPLSLIVCTGERMESLVLRLYGKLGLKTTTFEVTHSKGLQNEFRCFANFGWDIWAAKN